jgi:integrase
MAKITKKLVDGLQAQPNGEYWVWDSELPGFGVRVWPSGRKVYVAQYRAEGRTRRVGLGTHGAVTPEQARKEAVQVLAQVAKGADPAQTRDQGRLAPTVRELAERYLAQHASTKKKPKSAFQDTRLLERFILPAFGKQKVKNVNRVDVTKLHHSLRKTPYQANRVMALLSKMFNLAERWGLRPDGTNPCRHVEKYKEAKRERFLSPEELARLGSALAELEQEVLELPSTITAVRLLILTGCRREEVLGLKWEHVDLATASLRLPDSKTGAKTVYLNQPALEVLAQTPRLEGNPFVCPGLKPGEHLVGLPKAWGRIQKRAGVEGVRLHDLRHSFASVGAAAGLGLPIIGALLGHTQAATTQRYAHLGADPIRAANEEVGRRLAEAMNKPVVPKVVPLVKKG